MITDPDLASAIHGRAHWRAAGASSAIYQPPGTSRHVRVQRVLTPLRREQYVVVVMRGQRAEGSAPAGGATEAVRLAERYRLD